MPHRKTEIVRTACRGCHGVCQVLVHIEDGRVIRITGDPESRTSGGYLCAKGAAAPQLLYHPDRITYPLRRSGERRENRWQRISWDEALDEMAEKLDRVRKESGPEYFGMVQGTGRPYLSFNMRFANAFGTPNVTSPAHICYIGRVLASGITLGQLPVSDVYGFGGSTPACILLWGCNITRIGASDGLCGGVVHKAMGKADKVIVIDPRRTDAAAGAHHWLQIRPGTDGALALAMINVIIGEDLFDHYFVDNYTVGFDRLTEHVRAFTPRWASSITRIEAQDIRAVARTLAQTQPAAILWGNAIDMSPCSFHTARSILILMALVGSIDCPGGNVLWVPPDKVRQRSPFMNREVLGGDFLPPEMNKRAVDGRPFPMLSRVQSPLFWRSVVTGQPYRIRAAWIVGANPLVTQTHSLEIEKALELLEFLAVSDFFLTPTAARADLVLPAATWLEQDDVVNMHKIWCVLARKKVAQVSETRDDREIVIQLARRLGLTQAFPWHSYHEYLEWVLEETGMEFDTFCDRGIIAGAMQYYKYRSEGFNTPSGKFEIYSSSLTTRGVSPLPVYREPPVTPVSAPDVHREYPLILTSFGKVKEFFHSEGRQVGSLRRANPAPLVQIHPDTALSLGIADGDWVWVETPEGRVKMTAQLFGGVAPDVVAAQYGWWFPEKDPPDFGWKESSLNLLYGDMTYEPETGSESLRSVLCRIHPMKKVG